MTMKENTKSKNIHIQCGMAVDMNIKTSLVRRTLDNVTVVMIAFQNFEISFNGSSNKIDKNYKSNATEQKTIEVKKTELNYNSNKESSSYRSKQKSDEFDRNDKLPKNANTPQNSKANNVLVSLSSFKKGKDDSSLDLNANMDKQSRLQINSKNDDSSHKNNNIDFDKVTVTKDIFPSTTKNQKSSSFKGELLKK